MAGKTPTEEVFDWMSMVSIFIKKKVGLFLSSPKFNQTTTSFTRGVFFVVSSTSRRDHVEKIAPPPPLQR